MSENTSKLEIMDFWAEWCGPCHAMKPIIEELEKTYEGKVIFTKINVDEQPELDDKMNVRSIPTMFFKKGDKIVDQIVGAVPKDHLVAKIEEHLK